MAGPRFALQNNTWDNVTVPWAEYLGKDSSHGASYASGWSDDGGNTATFNILVNYFDGPTAELQILGWAQTVSHSGTTFLSRTMPARHPWKSWMVAERIISATPLHWTAPNSPEFLNNSGKITVSQRGQPFQGTLAPFEFWILSIGFVTPRYAALDDLTMQQLYGGPPYQEWNRFVEINPRTSQTTLSRDNSQWTWLDNGAGGTGAPTVGGTIPAPVGQSLSHTEITVKWKRVPRRGLFSNAGLGATYNATITSMLNKVNSTTTLWSAPGNSKSGVLRLVSIDSTPIPSPFEPFLQGLSWTDPNLYYDVTFIFDWFDPPYGNATYRGHNLAPNPGDNLWYLIGSSGTGTTIFPTADISSVFTPNLT